MKNGFICLHRQLLESHIWQSSTLEQRVILITLLLMVNYKAKSWEWKGKPFTCQPGQKITSVKSIQEKCGSLEIFTRDKVRTALKKFERAEFLTTETTNTGMLITIVNWQKYQVREEEYPQQNPHQIPSESPPDTQHLPTKEQRNKVTKKQDNNILAQNFDEFWNAYPKKRSKDKAYKAFMKINPDANLLATMLEKIGEYKKTEEWQKDNGQFIPYPSSWLNGRRWEDKLNVEISKDDRDAELKRKRLERAGLLPMSQSERAVEIDVIN